MQRIGGTPAPGSFVDQMSGNSIIDLCPRRPDQQRAAATGQISPFFGRRPRTTPYFHSGKHVGQERRPGASDRSRLAPAPAVHRAVGRRQRRRLRDQTRARASRRSRSPGVRVVANYWRQ